MEKWLILHKDWKLWRLTGQQCRRTEREPCRYQAGRVLYCISLCLGDTQPAKRKDVTVTCVCVCVSEELSDCLADEADVAKLLVSSRLKAQIKKPSRNVLSDMTELCCSAQWRQRHVEDMMWNAMGQKVKIKPKQKHSTSYFLAQAKRHGLVVVSGMALGGGIQGGNIEGYIVWISITLRIQKYFQLFSGSWNQTVWVPLMLCEEMYWQQMSLVWCLEKKKKKKGALSTPKYTMAQKTNKKFLTSKQHLAAPL